MTISAILFTTCTWEPEEVQPLSGTGECSEQLPDNGQGSRQRVNNIEIISDKNEKH